MVVVVLLMATAIPDAAGNPTVANTMAEYVLFLLAGGVILLAVDRLRDARRTSRASPAPGPTGPP